MSACVSPPQLSVSHIVEVAAIIAHAASTALPPLMKVAAPAVAARGLPVTATQFWPCSGGLTVLATTPVAASASVVDRTAVRMNAFMGATLARFPRSSQLACKKGSQAEARPTGH